ncbi:MAG: hypothetical protein AAF922_17220 [Pseudomonadota bacterium]
MADIDAALVQQILNDPERQREPDIEHHGQANDLGTGFEVTKWQTFCHQARLRKPPASLNLGSSDSSFGSDVDFGFALFDPVHATVWAI